MPRHVDNLRCWSCKASLEALPQPLSRHDECPACFEVLHCCRLCKHFDRNAVDGCREDRAEPPMRKEEANFCDYFEPTATPHGTNQSRSDLRGAASKLDALFGQDAEQAAAEPEADGTSDDTPEDDPRAKLDALFSKPPD